MQWGIESIGATIAARAGDRSAVATSVASKADGIDVFSNLMSSGVGALNADMNAAEAAVRTLAAGKPVELHEVMISLERAQLSVQTFIQVRNKLVESYQDLMRMQL
jgi:flagellar hook-basal body complex protein FliE